MPTTTVIVMSLTRRILLAQNTTISCIQVIVGDRTDESEAIGVQSTRHVNEASCHARSLWSPDGGLTVVTTDTTGHT